MAPTTSTSKSRASAAAAAASLPASGKKTKARVQRYLKSTEPQVKEGPKSKLLLKGMRCSHAMATVLQELRAVSAPHAKLLSKKNQIVPMESEGQQSLEFLCQKNDAALFAVASHNKKRPNHLTMGRTFDRHVLDLAELAVLRFKSMKDYGGSVPKKRIGSKPLLLFVGDVWQHRLDYRNLQNLLVDFYRGDVVDKIVATGLDHVIVFTAAEAGAGISGVGPTVLIHQRTYFCKLKKSSDPATTTPVPLLLPCGPDADLALRRTQWADRDLHSASRKQPASLVPNKKKRKNKATNVFGETLGRLHLERQNVDKMQGRKSKALRRAEKAEAQEEADAVEGELDAERRAMEREADFDHDDDDSDSD